MSRSGSETVSLAASLRIRFAAGERPYVFWVSPWSAHGDAHRRFKVLSKTRADHTLEVLVLQEGGGVRRKTLAQIRVPGTPSGWLERWVGGLAEDLGIHFERFDLRTVTSPAEWRDLARRLGWSLERKT